MELVNDGPNINAFDATQLRVAVSQPEPVQLALIELASLVIAFPGPVIADAFLDRARLRAVFLVIVALARLARGIEVAYVIRQLGRAVPLLLALSAALTHNTILTGCWGRAVHITIHA
jgi:hypothetical protein